MLRQIYELSNIERCKDLETYLETVNSIVLNRPSEENQIILKEAKKYFIDQYGTKIRGRGQSPKMADQIVHRTGRDTRNIVEQTLGGFCVKTIANHIWAAWVRKDPALKKIAISQMYNLTNKQIRELRSYFNTLPAQELAKRLQRAIFRRDTEGKPYPNVKVIKQVLKCRTPHEIKQIEFQYNDLFNNPIQGQSQASLVEALKTALDRPIFEKVNKLLEGFRPDYLVSDIHKLLENCAEVAEIGKNDPSLHHDFSGSFRCNYNSAAGLGARTKSSWCHRWFS